MQYGSSISFLSSTDGKDGKTGPPPSRHAVIIIVITMAIIQNYMEVS
jgi:hypothetical protein